MKKLLLLAAATVSMAACSVAPTAPSGPRVTARDKASLDVDACWSGYIVAYDADGNEYCTPGD